MAKVYLSRAEVSGQLDYRGPNGLTQMLKLYPVPPVAKIGDSAVYSVEQVEWLKHRIGPNAVLRERRDWKTPWDGTDPIRYLNFRMVGEHIGITRAHAYQLLRRNHIGPDAVAKNMKGYLPQPTHYHTNPQ